MQLLELTEEMLVWCYKPWKIRETLAPRFGVSQRTISKYIERVYKRWDAAERANPNRHRDKQIERLQKEITEAKAAKNLPAVAAFEALLSRVARTAPIEFKRETNINIRNQTSIVNNKLKIVSDSTKEKIRKLPLDKREELLDLLNS
jgi:transposase